MRKSKAHKRALKAANLDLFPVVTEEQSLATNRLVPIGGLIPDNLTKPAPATLYTKIAEHARRTPAQTSLTPDLDRNAVALGIDSLPSVRTLYVMYDIFNRQYFGGELSPVSIEYSTRMASAGLYDRTNRMIRLGRKYHELFPDDIEDTLKHEMIHQRHWRHDAAFKAVAARIGASVRAKAHPSLRRPPRYVYVCPACQTEYPRQKRLVMASCGKCSSRHRYDDHFKLKLHKSSPKKR